LKIDKHLFKVFAKMTRKNQSKTLSTKGEVAGKVDIQSAAKIGQYIDRQTSPTYYKL
jgi:hypothetical protein